MPLVCGAFPEWLLCNGLLGPVCLPLRIVLGQDKVVCLQLRRVDLTSLGFGLKLASFH
jgi:hypothetical protein